MNKRESHYKSYVTRNIIQDQTSLVQELFDMGLVDDNNLFGVVHSPYKKDRSKTFKENTLERFHKKGVSSWHVFHKNIYDDLINHEGIFLNYKDCMWWGKISTQEDISKDPTIRLIVDNKILTREIQKKLKQGRLDKKARGE